MMFRNDKQRKAMFAAIYAGSGNCHNRFSHKLTSDDIRVKRGYEKNMTDRELLDIIKGKVDYASLPHGTVEYFPVKDFGLDNALDYSDDFSSSISGGNIVSTSEPVYDSGIVVGYSSVASKDHRRLNVAPKKANPEFYDEIYEDGRVSESESQEFRDILEERMESSRVKRVGAYSDLEASRVALYDQYVEQGGLMDFEPFIERYEKIASQEKVDSPRVLIRRMVGGY